MDEFKMSRLIYFVFDIVKLTRKILTFCNVAYNARNYRQTTCLTELPDVAPCNGTVRLPPPCEDSPSSGSSKDRRDESPRRRCRVLAPVLLLMVVLLLGGLCLPFLLQSAPATHQQRLDVIRRILTEVPLIDGHNDLPWNVRKFVHNQLGEVNLSSDLGRVDPWARSDWSHTDIPRLRAGLVGAQNDIELRAIRYQRKQSNLTKTLAAAISEYDRLTLPKRLVIGNRNGQFQLDPYLFVVTDRHWPAHCVYNSTRLRERAQSNRIMPNDESKCLTMICKQTAKQKIYLPCDTWRNVEQRLRALINIHGKDDFIEVSKNLAKDTDLRN
ncbi:Dipeptidase 1 [Acromyrmex echinatior]|uniref:Dipeptidase n=1 Tax=Acromyrmex echinatior TaxID=103372 RepID=F4WD13_ACREC|nr:Dipeptidase 1 [Acromyrmex echinatior]